MEPAKYRETYDDSSEAAVRLCRKSNKRQSLASYHSIGSVNLANGCGSRIGRDEAALVHWVQIASETAILGGGAPALARGAGVRGSVSRRRRSAGSRSGGRGRAPDRSSNDRRCANILSTRFGLGLQCRDATLICDRSRATPSTLRVQRRESLSPPGRRCMLQANTTSSRQHCGVS